MRTFLKSISICVFGKAYENFYTSEYSYPAFFLEWQLCWLQIWFMASFPTKLKTYCSIIVYVSLLLLRSEIESNSYPSMIMCFSFLKAVRFYFGLRPSLSLLCVAVGFFFFFFCPSYSALQEISTSSFNSLILDLPPAFLQIFPCLNSYFSLLKIFLF